MLGDRDRDVDRLDHQLAVGNGKRYINIIVAVAEHALCQAHVVRACIGALRNGSSGEADQLRVEQRAVDAAHIIAAHGLLSAVIVDGARVAGDDDLQRRLGDLQGDGIADVPSDGIVRIVIFAVGFEQLSLIGADVRAGSGLAAGIAELARVEGRVIARRGHGASIGLLRAGIDLAGAVAADGDGHRRRVDLQFAVVNDELYGREALVDVVKTELRIVKTHRVGAGCGLGHAVVAAEVDAVDVRRDHIFVGELNAVDLNLRDLISLGGLLPAVVGLLDFIAGDVDRQRALSDGQGAEGIAYLIVGLYCRGIVPVDLITVRAIADRSLGTCRRDGEFLALDEAVNRHVLIGQRGAVVRLAVAAGRDGQRGLLDLQTAGTDIDAHAVVRILRQSRGDRICSIFEIGIVVRVFFRNGDIAKSRGARIILGKTLDDIPNVVQIFGLIAVMADHDVVRYALVGVGEAGLLIGAVIDVAGPAVGLDADGNVDLRDLEVAADVSNLIVSAAAGGNRFVAGILDHGAARRDRGNAGVQAAVMRIVIRIGIGQRNTVERVARTKAFHRHLVAQSWRQRERGAVILLGVRTIDGNGDFLLINEGELESGRCVGVGDLIVVAGRCTGRAAALDGLIELPARDRGAGEREGLADLQRRRHVVAGDRIAVHIDEVDRHGGAAEARIIEVIDVRFGAGGQDEGLLHRVGEELEALQLFMRRIQRRIIDRGCQLDDGGGIAGDVLDRFGLGDRNIAGILRRIEDVMDGILGRRALRAVDEGDDVLGIVLAEGQGLAALHRAIARDGDRLLGDRLSGNVVRVRDRLILGDVMPVLVLILDDVGDDATRPLGIDRRVRRYRHGPVEEGRAGLVGIPAFEGMAGVGRGSGDGRLLILLDGLAIDCRAAVGFEGDREARGDPLGIKLKVMSRHGVEDVGFSLESYVVVPAAPRIIAVVYLGSVGRLVGSVIICTARNVGFEEDV